jgi:hypothetical protein
MSIDTGRLTEGMTVVGPRGEEIGRVKQVRTADFLLDMSMRRDLFVPFSAISEVAGSVTLNVRREDIDDQDWEPSPLLGAPGASSNPSASDTPPREDRVVGTGDPSKRGTWSASSDSYDLEAIDTTEGRNAIEGTDDGKRPLPGDTTELDKLQDLSG